jgi:imidazolonepropionase-like amidohydrolase
VPTQACYDTAQLESAVAAAHEHGLSIVAHCRAADAIELCAKTGIDVIAHLEFLRPGPIEDFGGGAPTAIPRYDARIGEAVAASGAFLDLNPHSSGWDTLLRLRSASEPLSCHQRGLLRSLESYFDGMLDVIGQLASLGLADRMSFGSDAGPFDTEFGHPDYNVVLARLSGLSPAESLQVITRNAASSMGLGDEIGTIEVGKRADLVFVPGDPQSDPRVLASPRWVMRSGAFVTTETDAEGGRALLAGIYRQPTATR